MPLHGRRRIERDRVARRRRVVAERNVGGPAGGEAVTRAGPCSARLAEHERSFGADHPYTAQVLTSLGRLDQAEGALVEHHPAPRACPRRSPGALGKAHPAVSSRSWGWGRPRSGAGRAEEAQGALRAGARAGAGRRRGARGARARRSRRWPGAGRPWSREPDRVRALAQGARTLFSALPARQKGGRGRRYRLRFDVDRVDETFEEVASFIRQNEVGPAAPASRRPSAGSCNAAITAWAPCTSSRRWIAGVAFCANTHTSIVHRAHHDLLREEYRSSTSRSAPRRPWSLLVGRTPQDGGRSWVRLPWGFASPSRSSASTSSPSTSRRSSGRWSSWALRAPLQRAALARVGGGGGGDRPGREQVGEPRGPGPSARLRPRAKSAPSAGSNVTGVLTDVHEVNPGPPSPWRTGLLRLRRRWPLRPIRMNPADPAQKLDASSCRRTNSSARPGARASWWRTASSSGPGRPNARAAAPWSRRDSERGAVDYAHRLDEREEGGTPAIMGDLRAGNT